MVKINLDVLISREGFEIAEKVNIATDLFKKTLISPIKCKIFDGLIYRILIIIDHIKQKQNRGLGKIDNGKLTRLYCNTTYKN